MSLICCEEHMYREIKMVHNRRMNGSTQLGDCGTILEQGPADWIENALQRKRASLHYIIVRSWRKCIKWSTKSIVPL